MEGRLVIGMPTLVEFNSLEDNINLCMELGLDFIEINMNLPQFQPDKLDVCKLKYYQEKHDIFFTFHLPEELDIANFNKRVRNAYLDIIKDIIEIAVNINSPIINMHMNLGVYFTLPEKKVYLFSIHFHEYLDHLKYFGRFVDKLLKNSNVKISIENTGIYNHSFVTKGVSELLMCNNIVLTWDIGHDYSSGNLDREYMMKNMDYLQHLHIHDAIGIRNHLPLFSGEIDIHKIIDLGIKQKCASVIETKTIDGLKKSVSEMRKMGYF